MKNHKKRSENQSVEDWEKELTIKYLDITSDMAKVFSQRRSPSLQRCTRSLTLGVLALILSIGIGLIPSLPPTLSPATAFAYEIPDVPEPTCVGCGRKARIEGHGPRCPYAPRSNTGTGTGKTPSIGLPPVSSKSLLGLMLFQSLLSEALNVDAYSQESAQQAAQRAELNAWLKREQQRLNNLVKQQRAKRDAEDKASLEEMTKAMGSGFDTPMPNSDLASALSDPNVVDLRGHPMDKPLIVGSLKEGEKPGGTSFFGLGGGSAPPRIPASEEQLRIQATNKLVGMIKENRNPKMLDQRLQSLEEELAEALRQAKDLQNKSETLTKDYALYEKSVDSATRKTLMRGLSLLVDLTGDKKGPIMERLKVLPSDPDKWNRNLQAMHKIYKVAMYANKGMQYGIQSKEIYDYEMKVWTSGTNLKQDVDFILQNIPGDIFGPFAPHYKFCKFMLNTSADTIKLFVDLKELEVATKAYLVKQREIEIKIKRLVKAIKEHRQQLAMKLDVEPD